MTVHVIDEANRCLNCKKPMCRQGCPIQTPIPMMIKAFKEGNLNEAGEMLFENNPMSMICSLVCNHENQCEGHCVLGRKGEPVHISSIENYVSDTYFDKMQIPCQPKNGKKVAVIGAGPAGNSGVMNRHDHLGFLRDCCLDQFLINIHCIRSDINKYDLRSL